MPSANAVMPDASAGEQPAVGTVVRLGRARDSSHEAHVHPDQQQRPQQADLDQQSEPFVVEDLRVRELVGVACQTRAEALAKERRIRENSDSDGPRSATRPLPVVPAALLLGDDALLGKEDCPECAERARHERSGMR